jgi:hypothetical protein
MPQLRGNEPILGLNINKMMLLREGKKHWWSVLKICFKVKTFLMVFGQKPLILLFI